MQKSVKVLIHQYLIPHRLLTAITYRLMHAHYLPFRDQLVRFMIKRHRVNVEEALYPDYTDRSIHPTINSFFVRALKPGARPIAAGENVVCSPADGTISQIGNITQGRIIQAKGHDFSVQELLGGSETIAATFTSGHYTTIYLSPRDYHRVHIPYAGTLQQMVHVPGKLLSVAPLLIDNVERLFARNERVVCVFDTAIGPMAVILVGAINVGSIETVWTGQITPPLGKQIHSSDYSSVNPVKLEKGDELGRFNMGSTVIVLFANESLEWNTRLHANDSIQMGAEMGAIP
jgi:phosphatidylserine decarboxylase